MKRKKLDTKNPLVLGVKMSPFSSYREAIGLIHASLMKKTGGFICVAAAHLMVECSRDKALRLGVNNALAVTADGMPNVILLRLLGFKRSVRIYGPTLMRHCLLYAEKNSIPIFLFGGKSGIARKLSAEIKKTHKTMIIADCIDAPRRPVSSVLFEKVISRIRKSKAKIVFVGLGCPWQEQFMIRAYKKTNTLYVGVGGAFDFLSGSVRQAPIFVQNSGFEWLFRLFQEPKRLAYRYTTVNVIFVYLVLKFLFARFIRLRKLQLI